MTDFFQRFDLDLETFAKLNENELSELNLPQAGRELRKELLSRGYTVLESIDMSYSGVPKVIIVGGDYEKKHKEDFYELAKKLGLKYSSGECYIRRVY